MKICPNCNTEYADDVKFCLEDGTRTVDKNQKAQDPIIGQFVDRDKQYQVLSLLGEGGMGKVYRGHQASMNRDVAIKTLHKELLDKDQIAKRFRREALAASKLKHANAIEVYTFGQMEAPGQPFDGSPYMVMEFVSGKSLYKTIHEANRLDEARTIKIMLQVCDVLEEAHHQGIIHRDLKPENIVLTERGKNKDFVKVLDFGIAKMLQEEEAGGTKLTKAGTVFGTPEYLSPEQASGTPVDARSDIYSLGIILYEMLTGKVPFKSDTAVGLLIKHVNEPPKPIREFAPDAGISPAMEAIVMKALSKEPADRQQSVGEMTEALKAIQSGAAKPVVAATFVPGGAPPAVAAKPVLPATFVPGHAPAPVPFSAPQPMPHPASVAPVAPSMPPSPQTLSPVVLQQPPAQPANGATLAIILLAIFLGGGGAGSYFFYFKNQGKTQPNVTAQAPEITKPSTPAEPQKVTIDIDSSPRGANIFINGSNVGVTPMPFVTPLSEAPLTVVLQKEGFLQVTQPVTPNKTQPLNIKLTEDKGTTNNTTAANTKGNTTSEPKNTTPKSSNDTKANTSKTPTEPKETNETPSEPKQPKETTQDKIQNKKDKIKGILDTRGSGGSQ